MLQAEHEKLEVYGLAIETVRALDIVALSIPARRRDLRDQLVRASASIPLNIAEGASEFSGPEKARFYRMARRSSAECMSILDVAAPHFRSRVAAREAKMKLLRVSSMLTRMVNAQQERK